MVRATLYGPPPGWPASEPSRASTRSTSASPVTTTGSLREEGGSAARDPICDGILPHGDGLWGRASAAGVAAGPAGRVTTADREARTARASRPQRTPRDDEERTSMTDGANHPRAGRLPEPEDLVEVGRLLAAYHDERPDPEDPAQRVAFGTSGHRGTSLDGSFTEAHVVAISAAVCRHRKAQGIDGPLFLGRDTHALSEPAFRTIVEVLAAHGVDVVIDADDLPTPTPVISHAILTHNRAGDHPTADGIVVTPSHNPPGDGGFKYNPPHGGPADTDVTGWIEREANGLLEEGLRGVPRVPFDDAVTRGHDHVRDYVADLASVVD